MSNPNWQTLHVRHLSLYSTFDLLAQNYNVNEMFSILLFKCFLTWNTEVCCMHSMDIGSLKPKLKSTGRRLHFKVFNLPYLQTISTSVYVSAWGIEGCGLLWDFPDYYICFIFSWCVHNHVFESVRNTAHQLILIKFLMHEVLVVQSYWYPLFFFYLF